MECFKSLIGIKAGCETVEPTSGLYINSLPGISIDNANDAIDNEYYSGLDLIRQKIDFAQLFVANAVRATIQDKLIIRSLVNAQTIGFYKENNQSIALQNNYLKGIKVKIDQYKYFSFNLNSIKLKIDYTGVIPIYVYDLVTGNLLDTFNADSVAGEYSTVICNKNYFVNNQKLQLLIAVDSSLGNSHATDLTGDGNSCGACNYSNYSNDFLTFTGAKIPSASAKISSNIENITGTNGISIDYSLNCAIEPFICQMGSLLSWSILHKAGAEIMKEMVYSKRLNSVILIDRADNKELMDIFEAEYMASLKSILENIVIPNDICFDCNRKLRVTTQVP